MEASASRYFPTSLDGSLAGASLFGDVRFGLADEVRPDSLHRVRAERRAGDVRQHDEAQLLVGHHGDERVEAVNVAAMLDDLVPVPLAQKPAEAVIDVAPDLVLHRR